MLWLVVWVTCLVEEEEEEITKLIVVSLTHTHSLSADCLVSNTVELPYAIVGRLLFALT